MKYACDEMDEICRICGISANDVRECVKVNLDRAVQNIMNVLSFEVYVGQEM